VKTKHITLLYQPGWEDGPWFMSTKSNEPPKPKDDYSILQFVRNEPGEMIFTIGTKHINFRTDDPITITLVPGQTTDKPTTFPTVKGGSNKLTITNPNTDQTTTNYEYKLFFDTAPPLDPIIQNGCCRLPLVREGEKMNLVAESGAIGALMVAAVLIFLGASRMRWTRP